MGGTQGRARHPITGRSVRQCELGHEEFHLLGVVPNGAVHSMVPTAPTWLMTAGLPGNPKVIICASGERSRKEIALGAMPDQLIV